MTPEPTPSAAPSVPAEPEVFNNRIFAIKTTSKQERTVADNILKAIETKATDIKVTSIIVPNELQGYVLVETPEQRNRIEQLVEMVAHARALAKGQTTLAEVGHFLIPKPVVSGIDEGTIVELIAGPFKGEKAVVKRVRFRKGRDHGRTVRERCPDSRSRSGATMSAWSTRTSTSNSFFYPVSGLRRLTGNIFTKRQCYRLFREITCR